MTLNCETGAVTVADGATIAWDRVGEGPAVVLVHGIGSSRRTWDAMVPAIVATGHTVVTLDLRGFGGSSCPPGAFAMREFAADLAAFIDESNLERFHLVGHSLGGMIAQGYALDHPERVLSLTLASTTSHNGRRANAFARLMVLLAEKGYEGATSTEALRAEAEAILREAFPAGAPLEMLKRGVEQPNPSRANAWRACIAFSTKDRLAAIRCPTLVLHGTADMLIPFRAGELLAQGIAGARWLVEDGAGHSLPKERPESFAEALCALTASAHP